MRKHTCLLSVLSVFVLSVPSAGLISHATASPSPWEKMITKHKWDAIPDNWISLGHPPNGTTIKLHIALKANRENAVVDALHDVSNPRNLKHVLCAGTPQLTAYSRVLLDHFRYGAHLSREQVAELVAPHTDTLELVCSWLKYNGVPQSSISTTHGGGWLTIPGIPVAQANKLLGASYELYYHTWSNDTILRTVSYALPAVLHMHVNTIAPTTAFTSMRLLQQTPISHSGKEALENVTSRVASDVLSRVDEPFVDPAFLRWLYKMPFNNPTPTDENKLGIAGLANTIPSQNDLDIFMASFRSDVRLSSPLNQIVNVVPVNNGADHRRPPGKQANANTQYSVALTFPIQIEYYTIGGRMKTSSDGPEDGDAYIEWLQYMIDLDNVPRTISVPYYTREKDLPQQYASSVCRLFELLGARGVSILVASGDHGVGLDTIRRRFEFSTSFPASCACGV